MALVMAIGFTSCSSDDDSSSAPDCVAVTADVEAAFEAFFADPSVANCNAFKAALQAGLDAGCAETPEEEAEAQEAIDALVCE